ncbi:MAG: PAS domain-containing sensor histidine kinase [Chloroflexi bacterium]|nr:PAS domain-containing sensor histidine kinase [Chloroflexota bacterium]
MNDEYRRLLGEIRDAYCLLQDGKLILVSSELFRRFGYHPDSLIGKPFIDLIAPEARHQLLEIHRTKLKRYNFAERYESVAIAADGTKIPVEILGWLTEFNGRSAIAGIMTDISERKEQEVERMQLQSTLRSYASQVIRAQEEERGRIARDLHDDTIQELLFVSHRLQDIVGGTFGQLPKDAVDRLEEVRAYVERTMAGLRSFTQDIRPLMLDDMGLIPTLRWLAERSTVGVGGLHVNVRVTGERRRLLPDIELAFFRIAQEALNNARKHAGASAIKVNLRFCEERVELAVIDDGRGFDVPAIPTQFASQGKLGLAGMSERVLLLNGTFKIQSKLGKGTIVSIEVPR